MHIHILGICGTFMGGVAQLAQDVPVRAARRQRERPARSDADEPTLRVERVEQRKEVVLVRASPVEEDERALRLALGGTGAGDEAQRAAQLSRGFGIGVSTGSTCSRRCSKFGGSERGSPRLSSGSSVVKPRGAPLATAEFRAARAPSYPIRHR